MKLTHHVTVEYDDETQTASVYVKVCSSLYGCDSGGLLGALVADDLGRLQMVECVRRLAGSIAADHQEVDGLPRAL